MTHPPQPGPGGWAQPATNTADGIPPPNQRPAFYGNRSSGMPPGPSEGAPSPSGRPGQQPVDQARFEPPAQPTFPPAPGWSGGPGAWEQEPEGFAEEAEPRRRPLRWVLGALGVLVVAGAAAGGYVLLGGESGPEPGAARPVAQGMIDKVNGGDFGSLGGSLCRANRAELEQQLGQLSAGRFAIRLGPVGEQGDQARAELSGSYTLDGATMPVQQAMVLRLEDGQWKVCELGG